MFFTLLSITFANPQQLVSDAIATSQKAINEGATICDASFGLKDPDALIKAAKDAALAHPIDVEASLVGLTNQCVFPRKQSNLRTKIATAVVATLLLLKGVGGENQIAPLNGQLDRLRGQNEGNLPALFYNYDSSIHSGLQGFSRDILGTNSPSPKNSPPRNSPPRNPPSPPAPPTCGKDQYYDSFSQNCIYKPCSFGAPRDRRGKCCFSNQRINLSGNCDYDYSGCTTGHRSIFGDLASKCTSSALSSTINVFLMFLAILGSILTLWEI